MGSKNNNYEHMHSLSVGIGKSVELEVNDENQFWEIVDIGKSDVEKGKISYISPLIQNIIGAKKGDILIKRIMSKNLRIVIKDISMAK